MERWDLRVIQKQISPYVGRLSVIVFLSIICAFFEAVSLGALVPLLQIMESQQEPGGTLWGILKSAFSAIGIPLNFTTLLALITIVFLMGQYLLYVKKKIQVHLRVDFTKDMKVRVFREILSADISYHHSRKAGNFLNLLVTEIENAGYGLFAVTEYVADVFFIMVYALMLLYISIAITLIVVAISVIAFYFMDWWLKKSGVFGKQLVEMNTEQNEFLTERFSLLRLIKTSSTEPAEVDLFDRISGKFRDSHANYGIAGTNIEVIFQSIIFIIAVVVLFISIDIFNLQLALLFLFLFVLVRITGPLRDINMRRHELAREIPSFNKISLVLSEVTSHRKVKDGTREFPGFSEDIQFVDVSFSYDGVTQVLSDIDLAIPKNRMVALVGASGVGKSTIVDLVTRLVDPVRGSIEIDGVDIREYTLQSYRQKLGVVSQEIYIFNDTVLANICYGAGEISLDRAIEAAKVANAHDFVAQLPNGYSTILGERGAKLSGGQRQRIALARAIKERYTIIAIAHRLSTIENADVIAVLEGGRIVETGTHQALIRAGGTYARFYTAQRGSPEPGPGG